MPSTGRAQVVGVAGSPKVGKSTLVAGLITFLRAGQVRVGVLAVDPTSHRTGGALLGDRIRMTYPPDTGVFIRPMAT